MAFDDDSERTCRSVFEADEIAFGFFNDRKNPVGQFQQTLSDDGECQRNGFALEKQSVVGFQQTYLLGKGRLGQMQHIGGFGQVPCFAQGQQRPEMFQVYH